MKRQLLRNLSLHDKKMLSNRLRRQGLFLLLLCVVSLLMGVLVQPNNMWWAAPVLTGYIGGSIANIDSRTLQGLVTIQERISHGSPAEEYF